MVSWLDVEIGSQRAFLFGELKVEPFDRGWRFGPDRAGSPLGVTVDDPENLRKLVQWDDSGHYRPLSGARSMPGGWVVAVLSADALRTALEVVYPLATHHIAQAAGGSLRVVPLEAVLERQSGRYEKAAELSGAGRRLTTSVVCGQCVRTPAWADLATSDMHDSSHPGRSAWTNGGVIPCPDPCSIMVSFCRDAAQWEVSTPAGAPLNPAVGFAAFEMPGNALRERWLAAQATGEVLELEGGSGIPADSRH